MSPAASVPLQAPRPTQKLKPGTNHSVEAEQWAYPAATVQGWMEGTLPPPARKIVFLTFDDGPSGVTTPQILAILREHGVHATFFTVARQINDDDATLVRQAVADGNAVAIHSYGHDYKYLYPRGRANPDHLACDLDWAQATLQAVLGGSYRTGAFRYPGGHLSWGNMKGADAVLSQRKMSWIDWNSMTGDADAKMSANTTAEQVRNATRNVHHSNSSRQVVVLLQHDYHPNPLAASSLPGIIKHYKSQGYEFGIIA